MNDYCVISSNCISGFWYRDVVKKEYEIPFIWSIVRLSDMLTLIREFDTINFENSVAVMSKGELKRNDGDEWVKVIVDGKINVYFVHFKEDKELDKEVKVGINVFSPDVLAYTEQAWKRRSSRIPYGKKRVWVFWDDAINTNVDLQEFISISEERKDELFVLFTPKTDKTSRENLIVLPITDYGDVPKHAEDLKTALKKFENGQSSIL